MQTPVLHALIVDDQQAVVMALKVLLEIHGIPCLTASTPAEALRVVEREDVGVVLQDMNFTEDTTSGQEGVELFGQIRALDPTMPVLLMTAWTSLETAVQLVKQGATDYFGKPWDDDKLVRAVQQQLKVRALEQENVQLRAEHRRARRELERGFDLKGLVYESRAMQDLVGLAVKIASADVPVLITGPNGSGKERIAEIVQANSRRKDRPFVRVNAGALPDQLLEAELFGAEAGAFTGATKLRVGRFEAADGGTLFLDEIGNLPLSGQAKLLRVLQQREFERLGSSVTRKADVRIISATNADLKAAVAAGTFREDLYFRLNVIELYVPPLARRTEDVLPLAEHFLGALGSGSVRDLGDAARAALLAYDWPGNVRELENRLQRAVLVAKGPLLEPADLGLDAASAPARAPAPASAEGDAADKAALEQALVRAGGVVAKVAAELGLSRQALYRRMERLGITLERRPRG